MLHTLATRVRFSMCSYLHIARAIMKHNTTRKMYSSVITHSNHSIFFVTKKNFKKKIVSFYCTPWMITVLMPLSIFTYLLFCNQNECLSHSNLLVANAHHWAIHAKTVRLWTDIMIYDWWLYCTWKRLLCYSHDIYNIWWSCLSVIFNVKQ